MTPEEEKLTDADKTDKKSEKKRMTMTKILVTALLIIGVIGGYMPYILALLDKEVAESMGLAWVTEIVAVILGYLCKSYFESKQEGIQAAEDKKIEIEESKTKRDYTVTSSKKNGGSG